MVRLFRTFRWWAKALAVFLLAANGFFLLWFGAFSTTFAESQRERWTGVVLVLGSIALFVAAMHLVSGRRRYRHLPPE